MTRDIDWSEAPDGTTHAFQTLHGRPWLWEKHYYGMIYRLTDKGVWRWYRDYHGVFMSCRVERPET